jgi:hypothetical protein
MRSWSVHAENHRAAVGIGERDDSFGDFFRIGKFDFEFEVSVFTAANQT